VSGPWYVLFLLLFDTLKPDPLALAGAGVQTIAYAVQVPAPPFAVMAAMNFIVGWGLALQHAQCNGFVASVREGAHSKMSMLHALYGAGAVVSPFVATQFVHHPHWAYINIISCGLSAAVMVELAVVFKGRRQEGMGYSQA